jgi:hypothetical protein
MPVLYLTVLFDDLHHLNFMYLSDSGCYVLVK